VPGRLSRADERALSQGPGYLAAGGGVRLRLGFVRAFGRCGLSGQEQGGREVPAAAAPAASAIARTGATASRAVLFSGTTFVIALLGLFLVPTNVLRSLAAGAVIVGVVSVAAALTLIPAMLSLTGDRISALAIPLVGSRLGRADAAGGRVWRSVIAGVMRRPLASLVIAGGLMVLAAVPVLGLHIGQSGVTTLPGSLPSKQGYVAVARYFPGQDPYPVEIVTAGSSPADRADLARLQAVLAADPRFGPGPIASAPGGGVLALTVPIHGDAVSSRDVAAVAGLRQHLIPCAFAGSATRVYVGGKTAETAVGDKSHAAPRISRPYGAAIPGETSLLASQVTRKRCAHL
jgi:RND superfamily putative drug exporter